MQEIEVLRRTLKANPNAPGASASHKCLTELRQKTAMQMKRLRGKAPNFLRHCAGRGTKPRYARYRMQTP